jgi:Family of unknown function (DUF6515)
MKRLYKYVSGLFLTGLLSIAVINTASAQHGGGGFHGGGGGGFHGGGGGFHSSGISARGTFGLRGSTAFRGSAIRGAVSYNRGGFYRAGFGYYGYPHLGFYLGVLPFGYYPFYWGDNLFYYCGGVFYRPYDGGGYEVTTPPLGAAVPSLPEGAKSIVIDGQQFYEMNGVYYKPVVNDQGKTSYEVAGRDGVLNTDDSGAVAPDDAAPKVGDIVNELPDGCHKVSLNGKKYFVSPNDIYYQPYTDGNGNAGYRIASIPDNDDQDN